MQLRFRSSSAIFLFLSVSLWFGVGPGAGFGQSVAGPTVIAKFEKIIDSKSAKVGEAVTAKTLNSVRLPDETTLPKGSKLIAKVALVKSKKEGDGQSMLMFRFDQAEVKGGAVIPIKGLVVAIGPSLAPDTGFGQGSVLGRNGQGNTPGLDPNAGMGKAGAKDEYNIAAGSTIVGVGLGVHQDADWTTVLKGFKKDIWLDSDVLIKVQLKQVQLK